MHGKSISARFGSSSRPPIPVGELLSGAWGGAEDWVMHGEGLGWPYPCSRE